MYRKPCAADNNNNNSEFGGIGVGLCSLHSNRFQNLHYQKCSAFASLPSVAGCVSTRLALESSVLN